MRIGDGLATKPTVPPKRKLIAWRVHLLQHQLASEGVHGGPLLRVEQVNKGPALGLKETDERSIWMNYNSCKGQAPGHARFISGYVNLGEDGVGWRLMI